MTVKGKVEIGCEKFNTQNQDKIVQYIGYFEIKIENIYFKSSTQQLKQLHIMLVVRYLYI